MCGHHGHRNFVATLLSTLQCPVQLFRIQDLAESQIHVATDRLWEVSDLVALVKLETSRSEELSVWKCPRALTLSITCRVQSVMQ